MTKSAMKLFRVDYMDDCDIATYLTIWNLAQESKKGNMKSCEKNVLV